MNVRGEKLAIHSNEQTIFVFTHIDDITLGASEEAEEFSGEAGDMGVDRTVN